MTTATQTTTLIDFWNDNDVKSIWFVSTAQPCGTQYWHRTNNVCDEDYCDLGELFSELFSELHELTGTIDEDGDWQWDGNGTASDVLGNSIVNIKLIQ